jgi:hypothetical protein
MKKIFFLISILLITFAYYQDAEAQDSPKKIFDLIPTIPKSYEETLDPERCQRLTQFKENIESVFKLITPALQELHPKVQAAMMSNPMIFANEAMLNLMQYGSHEYFEQLNEEFVRVKDIIEAKRTELYQNLSDINDEVNQKYKCDFPAGSTQETECLKAKANELFSKEVKAYNQYLSDASPDLNELYLKLKKFILYIHDNITAIPDQTNDAVRFHILSANQISNTFIMEFTTLIDIHCIHPDFIHKPE